MRKSKLYDYDFGTGLLQYRSRPERYGACQGKGKFGKLGGGSHEVLIVVFMVPLGYPGVRSIAQVLRLPFEYYSNRDCS